MPKFSFIAMKVYKRYFTTLNYIFFYQETFNYMNQGLVLQTWHTATHEWLMKWNQSLLTLTFWKVGYRQQYKFFFLPFVLLVSIEKITKIIKIYWGHLCLFIIERNINSHGYNFILIWKQNKHKRRKYITWISPHKDQKRCEASAYVFASTYKVSRSFSDTCIVNWY